MGLATVIRKTKMKERHMRILILYETLLKQLQVIYKRGLDCAGKSTVVARWIGENISDVAPTFGFKIRTCQRSDYHLHLWDIGGQRTIRAYWRNYFEETDGLVFVLDSAAPHRFLDAMGELRSLLGQDRLANATILILANKQDCPDAVPPEQIREMILGMNILKKGDQKTHWSLFPCSAVTEENISESLDWLVTDISKRIYKHTQKATIINVE